MPFVHVDGGHRLSYETFGRGPLDVVLMHGWGGASSGHSWKGVLRALDLRGLRVIAVDLRGHGRSDGAMGGFTTERFAADVLAVASHAGAKRFVSIGFSMSGRWSQWLGATAAERVAGQILVAPVPAVAVPLPDDVLEQWIAAARDPQAWSALVRTFTKAALPADVVQDYFGDVSTTPEAALRGTYDMCRAPSFLENLASTVAPALVVAGSHDPFFPPSMLRELIVDQIPHSRIVQLDCGHEIPVEEPVALAGLIEAFCCALRD